MVAPLEPSKTPNTTQESRATFTSAAKTRILAQFVKIAETYGKGHSIFSLIFSLNDNVGCNQELVFVKVGRTRPLPLQGLNMV